MTRGPRRHRSTGIAAAAAAAAAFLVPSGWAAGLGKVFYLDARPGQCWAGKPAKTLTVVPCSNAQHRGEVYAVVHGGWPGAQVPARSAAYAAAQRECNLAFARKYGHAIGRGYGWEAFWPDPGAEAAKYHDRIVCSLVRWPGLPAMGPGTHFRVAR